MLLEPSSEASLGLSGVDLSTRAWYLVHDVRLLLGGERVFDLSEHRPESRARPKHHFDVVVPARLSDPLTNTCSHQVESREPCNLSSPAELNCMYVHVQYKAFIANSGLSGIKQTTSV